MLPSLVHLPCVGASVQVHTDKLVQLASGPLGGPLWQIVSRIDEKKTLTNLQGMLRLLQAPAESIGKRCVEMIVEMVENGVPMKKHVQFGFSEMFAMAPEAWTQRFYQIVMTGLGEKGPNQKILSYIQAIENARSFREEGP